MVESKQIKHSSGAPIYKWFLAKLAKLARLKRIAIDKYSSLFCLFAKHVEEKLLYHQLLVSMSLSFWPLAEAK